MRPLGLNWLLLYKKKSTSAYEIFRLELQKGRSIVLTAASETFCFVKLDSGAQQPVRTEGLSYKKEGQPSEQQPLRPSAL